MVYFHAIPAVFWDRLNLKLIACNERGSSKPNIWLFYFNDSLSPIVMCNTVQRISITVSLDNITCWVSFVYTATNYIKRRELWDTQTTLGDFLNGPWMAIGDFNALLGAHEKSGGLLPHSTSCMEFQEMSEKCNFIHVPTSGPRFT